ncbi:hypothetical protein FQZ97_702470 [compost metagenome]
MLAVFFTFIMRSYSHAQCGRNGSRGVANTKSVVLTFADLRETADAIDNAVSMKTIFTAGKDLMTIGLVTHIPY